MNPFFPSAADRFFDLEIEIRTDTDADEFRSYVGNWGNQRQTWYAIERKSGIILAWHNGRRTDESCARLMDKLSVFPVKCHYTDNQSGYSKYVPSHKHIIGKDNTWKIERKNLDFRTHIKRLNRKTVCFSKNEKIHDNVIGLYICRYYFQAGRYSETA